MTIEAIERNGRPAFKINAGQAEYVYYDRAKALGRNTHIRFFVRT